MSPWMWLLYGVIVAVTAGVILFVFSAAIAAIRQSQIENRECEACGHIRGKQAPNWTKPND